MVGASSFDCVCHVYVCVCVVEPKWVFVFATTGCVKKLGAGKPGEVSQYAQSIIYIDNWSCDFNITRNVIDDCNGTKQVVFKASPMQCDNSKFSFNMFVGGLPASTHSKLTIVPRCCFCAAGTGTGRDTTFSRAMAQSTDLPTITR